MKTTLNKIREHSPCRKSWEKLLQSLSKTQADDDPIEIRYILDLLGVRDAIWALRAVDGHDREIRLFACDCAESVLHIFEKTYSSDSRPRNAIDASRRLANNKATEDELRSAYDAACVARDAAFAAARDARYAACDAAFAAAFTAARDARYAACAAARAARDAAFAAARDAACDAACAARYAACAAGVRDAELEKQKEFLLKYI